MHAAGQEARRTVDMRAYLWDDLSVKTHPKAPLWAAYVATFGQGMTQAQIGQKAGVDQATVGRWLNGKNVPTDAAVVANLALAFGRNPLEAFVAASFLTEEQAGRGLEAESREVLAELRLQTGAVDETSSKIHALAYAEILRRERIQEVLPPDVLSRVLDDLRRRYEQGDPVVVEAVTEVPLERMDSFNPLWPMRMRKAEQAAQRIVARIYGDEPFDLPEADMFRIARELRQEQAQILDDIDPTPVSDPPATPDLQLNSERSEQVEGLPAAPGQPEEGGGR